MTITTSKVVATLAAMTLFVTGCATTPAAPLRYGVRRIQGAERSAMFASAQQVLVDLGYPLDRVDAASGVITTRATQVEPGTLLQRQRSRLSSPGRGRRIAEVRVVQGDSGIDVFCQVVIQRLTTEAHRMFEYESPDSDVPNQTAIERDAATNIEQNTVWQTIRRDRGAELRILDGIAKRSPDIP